MFGFVDTTLFLGFCAAAATMIVVPGPLITVVMAASLANGPRAGLLLVWGSQAATAVMLIAAVFGLNSIVLWLTPWLWLVSLAGGLFLMWMGIETLRARRGGSDVEGKGISDRHWFRRGFLIGITNPKSIVFFAAFFTRFLSPKLEPLPQLTAMAVAFFVMAGISDSSYAIAAGKARHLLSGLHVKDRLRWLSGGVLLMLGLLLLADAL